MKNNKLLSVVSIFFLVFAFSTIDSAISPLVAPIGAFYQVPQETTLLLISYCTVGIVLGIIFGPLVLAKYKIKNALLLTILTMAVAMIIMTSINIFWLALCCRFIIGLGSGLITNIVWWATYSPKFDEVHKAMVNTVMSARPLAVALGVPLVGVIANFSNWQTAFIVFIILLILFGLTLYSSPTTEEKAISGNNASLLSVYKNVLAGKTSRYLYIGMCVNRMCYFGFYSMLGIWFSKVHNIPGNEIVKYFLFIGLIEGLTSFCTIATIKYIDIHKLFFISIFLSVLCFILLIKVTTFFPLSLAFFSIFVFLDRIYSTILVMRLPKILPGVVHKTMLGTMLTISSWIGLAIISLLESILLKTTSIVFVEYLLLFSLIGGLALILLAYLPNYLHSKD